MTDKTRSIVRTDDRWRRIVDSVVRFYREVVARIARSSEFRHSTKSLWHIGP